MMAKFVFLAIGGDGAKSEAEQAALGKAMGEWMNSFGSAIVDMGNPFMPNAKSISTDGTISDGPIGPLATGYMIVEAGSLDEATKMAKVFPGLKYGTQLTVYEAVDVGEM
jgi:hypothetical protein